MAAMGDASIGMRCAVVSTALILAIGQVQVGAAVPDSDAVGLSSEGTPGVRAQDLGRVSVDADDRSLRFPVTINQRTGPVEYAVVTEQGKIHESVFRTDVEPTHIHLGLLLLGGKPSYAKDLPRNATHELPGELVLISVVWFQDGVETVRPLSDFVVTVNTGYGSRAGPLEPGPWVYNGSIMTGTGIEAQTLGSIVSLMLDPAALVNNPRPGRVNDELHRANPAAFAPGITQFEIVMRLARDVSSEWSSNERSSNERLSNERLSNEQSSNSVFERRGSTPSLAT